ncbi:nucleoside hydrolase [Falsiroseomonas oryzae]|uniref:nucleoside hydrolase n=1 Tax=Falsiroseomonas oryzae TaxID=2766473 RepID=UPI0022EAC6EC|nr:nucleoside hydrolase [Roseomonas sp. MO-31]
MPEPLIIDCDPGQDDAVALLVALASPEAFDLLGVCTVGGNVPLDLTTTNALKVLELAGRADVPVYAGCQTPLMRPLVTAEYVMGNDGLAGAALPPPTTRPSGTHAVQFLVDALRRATAPVTIATLGPLTNLALALVMAPEIRARIGRLVVMGGTMHRGNIVPQAEYNIYVDPHAARIVLNAGLEPVIIGLDVTHQVVNSVARIATIERIGTRAAVAVARMFMPHAKVQEGLPPDSKPRGLMHDPCVIAWLLQPGLFGGRHVHVGVETDSEVTLGATVVDWWGVTKRLANATVLNQVDVEGFFALVADRLARLP